MSAMKRTSTIIAVCLLFLSSGCGNEPRIGKLTDSSVIAAFGDSLTAGTGASTAESYPAVLEKKIGHRVVNAGLEGERTAEGILRLPTILREQKPTLLILCEGGNDLLQEQDEAITQSNLTQMVTLAQASGADVLLIGVPRPGLSLRVPGFYKTIAKEHGIPMDLETVAGIVSKPSLKADMVHPNADGYRVLGEAAAKLISQSERR